MSRISGIAEPETPDRTDQMSLHDPAFTTQTADTQAAATATTEGNA